jgi:hypothetical protein
MKDLGQTLAIWRQETSTRGSWRRVLAGARLHKAVLGLGVKAKCNGKESGVIRFVFTKTALVSA